MESDELVPSLAAVLVFSWVRNRNWVIRMQEIFPTDASPSDSADLEEPTRYSSIKARKKRNNQAILTALTPAPEQKFSWLFFGGYFFHFRDYFFIFVIIFHKYLVCTHDHIFLFACVENRMKMLLQI